ncbi:MAG: hypothetical protein PHC97_00385 [Patescibacteria group bacterium]|nr:hypothetical protein [Patescibacteria group bacterium]
MKKEKVATGVAKKMTNWMLRGKRHQVIPNKKRDTRHPKHRPDYRNCDD